jgi:hypothetical protein
MVRFERTMFGKPWDVESRRQFLNASLILYIEMKQLFFILFQYKRNQFYKKAF